MQVKAFGGLSDKTKRRLRDIAEAVRNGNEDSVLGPRIKPGTRLIRLWQDKTHSITVLEDGFDWDGKRFNSLSRLESTVLRQRRRAVSTRDFCHRLNMSSEPPH